MNAIKIMWMKYHVTPMISDMLGLYATRRYDSLEPITVYIGKELGASSGDVDDNQPKSRGQWYVLCKRLLMQGRMFELFLLVMNDQVLLATFIKCCNSADFR